MFSNAEHPTRLLVKRVEIWIFTEKDTNEKIGSGAFQFFFLVFRLTNNNKKKINVACGIVLISIQFNSTEISNYHVEAQKKNRTVVLNAIGQEWYIDQRRKKYSKTEQVLNGYIVAKANI